MSLASGRRSRVVRPPVNIGIPTPLISQEFNPGAIRCRIPARERWYYDHGTEHAASTQNSSRDAKEQNEKVDDYKDCSPPIELSEDELPAPTSPIEVGSGTPSVVLASAHEASVPVSSKKNVSGDQSPPLHAIATSPKDGPTTLLSRQYLLI